MNQLMQSNYESNVSRYPMVELAGVIAGTGHIQHNDGRMPHIGRRERRRSRNNRH